MKLFSSKIIIKSFLPVFSAIILFAGIAYAVWTEPTATPPGNNVAAPINTGDIEQTKTGDICTTAPNGTGAKKCLSTVGGGTTSGYCGDGSCNNGETCSSCPGDCGACPVNPYCGDGSCNSGETCSSCPGDCGACPTCECGGSPCGSTYTGGDCGLCFCAMNNLPMYTCIDSSWVQTGSYTCPCHSCG